MKGAVAYQTYKPLIEVAKSLYDLWVEYNGKVFIEKVITDGMIEDKIKIESK